MISSMYRSQGFLAFESSLSVSLQNNGKTLTAQLEIANATNVAGTKPKVQIQFFSPTGTGVMMRGPDYIGGTPSSKFNLPAEFLELNFKKISAVETNSLYSQNILYPKDTIVVNINSTPNDQLPNVKYLIVIVDCMFLESIRKSDLYIFEEKSGEFELRARQTLNSDGTGMLLEVQSLLARIKDLERK